MWIIIGGLAAFAAGVWIGVGHPGIGGAEDRVLPRGRARRPRPLFTPLDLLRKRQRPSERRRS